MNPKYRLIVKFWSIALAISLATSLIRNLVQSPEAILLARLAGTAFFVYMYFYMSKIIKKQDEIIKQSNGFAHRLFDPFYLKLILQLSIIGWTAFIVMDYLALNTVDWILVFLLGVVIFPFAMGVIPIRLHDNKDWRRR